MSGCRGADAAAWGKMVREARLAGCQVRPMRARLRSMIPDRPYHNGRGRLDGAAYRKAT